MPWRESPHQRGWRGKTGTSLSHALGEAGVVHVPRLELTVRILADRSVWRGHAECVFTAPELFALEDEVRVCPLADGVDGALSHRARDAEDVCPVHALTDKSSRARPKPEAVAP